MTETTIKVRGMSCGHCVKTIEQTVGALGGVTAVTVDLKAGEVKVRFDSQSTNVPAIVAVIEDAGYEASAP